jgi:hypothetical protein
MFFSTALGFDEFEICSIQQMLLPILSLKKVVSDRLNRLAALLNNHQTLQTSVIGCVNDNTIAQMTLGFRCFFTHQVAHASPITLDFTGTSHLETLLGAGMGFHLRHDTKVLVEKWSAKVTGYTGEMRL